MGIRRDKIMIYGAMLAGGVGSRMKSAVIPKQFLEVDGKPIIIYTLQNMLKVDRFDYIYIATHKDYLAYMKEMVQNIQISRKKSGLSRAERNVWTVSIM